MEISLGRKSGKAAQVSAGRWAIVRCHMHSVDSSRAGPIKRPALFLALFGSALFGWSVLANAQDDTRQQHQFVDKRPLPKSTQEELEKKYLAERQQREAFDQLLKKSNQRLSELESHLARIIAAQKSLSEGAEAKESRHKAEISEERRQRQAVEQALAQAKEALRQANQRFNATSSEDQKARKAELERLRVSIDKEYAEKLAAGQTETQRAQKAAADAQKQLAAATGRTESLSRELQDERAALKLMNARFSAVQEELQELRQKQQAEGSAHDALVKARAEAQQLKGALDDVRTRLGEREKLLQEEREKFQAQLEAVKRQAAKSARELHQSELKKQVAAAQDRVRQQEQAKYSARIKDVRAAASEAFEQRLKEVQKRADERLGEVRAAAERDRGKALAAAREAPPGPTNTTVAALTRPAQKNDAGSNAGGAAKCGAQISSEPLEAGRLRLVVQSPCRAGEPVLLDYGGTPFQHVLDDDGSLTTELDLFLGSSSRLIVRFSEGYQQTVDLSKADLRDVTKVAIVWQGGVNLDLHVLEYAAGFGGEGHVWADVPSSLDRAQEAAGRTRRGRGFLSSTSKGRGEGLQVEVYTFLRSKNQRTGTLSLIVDHASRGDMPRGEMCGSGRFASVGFQMIWLERGEVTYSGRGLFAVAPCDQKLSKEQRFNRYAVEDLQVR